MKTMMKKCGRMRAYAGVCAAAVLVLAALVIGCTNPGVSGGKDELPEGMGAVNIKFNDAVKQSRATILPDSTTNIASFLGGFHLDFNQSAVPKKTVDIAQGGSIPTITLVAGTYNLVVVAYLDTAKTNPGASYTETITITAGDTKTITIVLEPIVSTGTTGTFAWNITHTLAAPDVTKAEMTITPIGGGSAITPSTNLLSAFATSPVVGSDAAIPTGYYYVDFEFIVQGTTTKFRHVLHIYQNMTSTFTYSFTNNHFSLVSIQINSPITYTNPTETLPTLTVSTGSSGNGKTVVGSGTAAAPYILTTLNTSSTNADVIDITVTNATASFDSVVVWFNGLALTDVSGVYTLNGSAYSALSSLLTQLTVTGIKDSKPSSLEIYIKVVND